MRVAIDKIPHNRRRKISKEIINAILSDIALGSTRKHASESNGISEPLFYYWIKQGELELSYADIDTLHTYLVKSLRSIEKEEIVECRRQIKSSDKGHRGAEWTLEKVYWRYFGTNAADIEFNERLERLEAQHGEHANGNTDDQTKEETSEE